MKPENEEIFSRRAHLPRKADNAPSPSRLVCTYLTKGPIRAGPPSRDARSCIRFWYVGGMCGGPRLPTLPPKPVQTTLCRAGIIVSLWLSATNYQPAHVSRASTILGRVGSLILRACAEDEGMRAYDSRQVGNVFGPQAKESSRTRNELSLAPRYIPSTHPSNGCLSPVLM